MLILGHRGTTVHAVENTLAAVEWALANGADGVEVDVRRTTDGRLVCCHDPATERLGGGPRPLLEQTWAEIAAGPVAVPLVTDLLDAVRGRGRVVLEVKNVPGEPDFDAPAEVTARALVDLLQARGAGDEVVVSSFDWFAIDAVHELAPEIRTGFLTPPGIAAKAGLAFAVEHGHPECHPHYSEVLATPEVVEQAAEAGVAVACWTVDDPAVADRLAAYGVSAVISNDVTALRR